MYEELGIKYKKENRKSIGFTLIELLVVISIIGILAGLLMTNFVSFRQRGRDGVRKSDLRQIQSALELYRSDQGSYKPNIMPCGSPLTDPSNTITYMQKIPCDPLNNQNYSYSSPGTTYILVACLENTNDPQKDASNICGVSTRWSHTVINP